MRAFLLFWALPLGFFWFWFFSAQADLGFVFFSREVFDRTFAVYEQALGMNASEMAMLIFKATVVDSLILLAILAFRRRRKIAVFVRSRAHRPNGEKAAL